MTEPPAPLPAPPPAPPAPTPSAASRPLLLADDDDDVARVFTRALERAGFSVHRARTGSEAMAMSQGMAKIAAAVVDLVLPGAGGLDIVRSIRTRSPECRIVAVTGLADPHLAELFRDAGADRLLTKPVDLDQLLEALAL